jgi:hypothetical protein
MSASVNITIMPPLSGSTEVFKYNTSLGVVTSSSTFIYNVGDPIILNSTPNEGYEFSHYIQPNGNNTTDPEYNDTIITNGEKNITTVFNIIGSEQKYSCIDGNCKEDENGIYDEPTCNKDCYQEEPNKDDTNIGLIFGLGVIAWILFKKEKGD